MIKRLLIGGMDKNNLIFKILPEESKEVRDALYNVTVCTEALKYCFNESLQDHCKNNLLEAYDHHGYIIEKILHKYHAESKSGTFVTKPTVHFMNDILEVEIIKEINREQDG